VPAEVSKRGVMMFNFEGALSSRPKRTKAIITKKKQKSSGKYHTSYKSSKDLSLSIKQALCTFVLHIRRDFGDAGRIRTRGAL
jgi:hypothetical protein